MAASLFISAAVGKSLPLVRSKTEFDFCLLSIQEGGQRRTPSIWECIMRGVFTTKQVFVMGLFLALHLDLTAANDSGVRFDAPAMIAVRSIASNQSHDAESSSEKVIELLLPVTSEIGMRDRGNVSSFRFDIVWNQQSYPLVNYAPKTQTSSEIEGLIDVEKNEDQARGIGGSLNGRFPEMVNGSLKADLSSRTGSTVKYHERPQQDVLVASGTTNRGCGVFFRFHPSKQTTLEGGRDLVIAFRVPKTWSGGVIKLKCSVTGKRQIIGSWSDSFEESCMFVIPIYLEGDDQARDAARDFVDSETKLRINWDQLQNRATDGSTYLHRLSRTERLQSLPPQWAHRLIQSGRDEYLEKYRSNLPQDLADVADQFVLARKGMFALSR
ncbi:hypothetical protein N9B68_01950 [bacterium]|nr:hypothetical protein [bacterium]MDA7925310.1 hypothetical protein [Mariniblastus sp.]MDB4458502.1 hypothetical protein [bacterium]MDB4564435.1 hypothetical protein [Mariniblastus sp.]